MIGGRPGFQPLHPADQHFGVAAVDVHAVAVDVEISEGDVVEPVHVVEGAKQPFVEGLGGPVEGAVVVRILPLRRRKLLGHAVHRCRGCGDDLLDVVLDAQFEQIEGRVHHDFHGQARLGGAMGDAQCSLMKDDIGSLHQRRHQLAVADIALDQANGPARHAHAEDFPAAL